MQSFSNVLKSPTHSCVSPVPPDTIGKQELCCLESVLLLIKGLSLNKPLDCLQQFIESIILFKIVPLLQKCLSLSHGNMNLVANTLAVLLLTLLYLPHNINIIIDIIIGKYLEGNIKHLYCNGCILMIYLSIFLTTVLKNNYNLYLLLFIFVTHFD